MKNKTKRKIKINGVKIEYILKKAKRSRSVKLVVCCEGSLTVVAPKQVSVKKIEGFIVDKVDWIVRKIQEMKSRKSSSLFYSKNKEDYKKFKEDASNIIKERLEFFNGFYGFQYNKVVIRNQQTRWGSCSSNRNLNFNFRVAFLKQELVDYLVVHELCHLKEMNHSSNFWSLVRMTMPEYKKLSRELRRM